MPADGSRSLLMLYQDDERERNDEVIGLRNMVAPPKYTEQAEADVELPDNEITRKMRSISSLKHQAAITYVGFGTYQHLLLVFCGLGMATDSVVIYMVAYTVEGAERDLCMSTVEQGWVTVMLFSGITLGALAWGILGDAVGRRKALILGQLITVGSNVFVALAGSYMHMTASCFIMGIGLGGCVPITYSYFSEVVSKENRAFSLTLNTVSWVIGALYAITTAYVLVGGNILYTDANEWKWRMWRTYVTAGALPCGLSLIGFFLVVFLVVLTMLTEVERMLVLSESPMFLMQAGRFEDALESYLLMFEWNRPEDDPEEARRTLHEILFEDGPANRPPPAYSKRDANKSCWGNLNFGDLFCKKQRTATLVILTQWICILGATYGITIWYPTLVIEILQSNAVSSTVTYSDTSYSDLTFTETLKYHKFVNCTFDNVKFKSVALEEVYFVNSTLNNVSFNHVRTAESSFTNTVFNAVSFNNTDYYDSNFISLDDSSTYTFSSNKSCELDFGASYSLSYVYFQDAVTTAVYLPGCFLSAYMVDEFGRKPVQMLSCFVAAFASLSFIEVESTDAIFAAACFFTFSLIIPFNVSGILSCELLPTHVRTTGIGLASSIGRICTNAVLLFFTYYINLSRAIPICIAAGMLVVAGVAMSFVEETRDWLV